MIKRTTIDLDQDLVARAKGVLGLPTTRAVVEEALRRTADAGEASAQDRATRQLDYLKRLSEHLDLDVYGSEDMWR